jgi:hypothetical protein
MHEGTVLWECAVGAIEQEARKSDVLRADRANE